MNMSMKPGAMIDLQEFSELLEFERFSVHYCAINSGVLAVVTNQHLLLTWLDGSGPEDSSSLTVEFVNDDGKPSCLEWLDDMTVVVGFENGYVRAYTIEGQSLFSFKAMDSCVQKVRSSEETRGVFVWVLYEDGLLITVNFNAARENNFSDAYGFQLKDFTATSDFLIYAYIPSLQDLFNDIDEEEVITSKKKIVVTGSQCAMAIYHLDIIQVLTEEKQKSQLEREHSSSFTKSIFNIMASFASNSDSSKSKEADKTWSRKRQRDLYATNMLVDAKRRIIRISIDPEVSLLAAADGLGRVTLFDLHSECAVRLWKGLRDAHLGWILEPDDNITNPSTPSISSQSSPAIGQRKQISLDTMTDKQQQTENIETSLKLAIFAPLLGLISIYKMKNGPCVRVIPVGMNVKMVQLFVPMVYDQRNALETVVPLRCEAESKCLEVLSLASSAQSETALALLLDMLETQVEGLLESSSYDAAHDAHLVEDGEETEESDLKHSDLQTSIQEAIKLQKKHSSNKNPELLAKDEFRRLMKLFIMSRQHAHSHSQSYSGNSENAGFKVEQKLLQYFTKLSSLSLLLQFVHTLERCEMSGFTFPLEKHDFFIDQKVDNSYVITIGNLSFSTDFHCQLHDIIDTKITQLEEATAPVDLESVKLDFLARKQLLLIFIRLHEFHSSEDRSESSHNGGLTPQVLEEVTTITRLSSPRAEALCWTMRVIKSQEKKMVITPLQVSITQGVFTPNSNVSSPAVVSSSASPNKKMVSLRQRFAQRTTSHNDSFPRQKSSSTSTPVRQQQSHNNSENDIVKLNFSTFCAFFELIQSHTETNTQTIRFHLKFDVLCGQQSGVNYRHLMSIQESQTYISTIATSHALQFLFTPMLGDLGSLHEYTKDVIRLISPELETPLGVRYLLPSFFVFLSQTQSCQTYVTDLLVKKNSSSCSIQRWLRDHLLTFQDMVAEYMTKLKAKPQQAEEGEAEEEGKEENVVHQMYLELLQTHAQQQPEATITFDSFTSLLFQSTYDTCTSSDNLEAVFTSTAIILETLYGVNDQIERRTYGRENMKQVIFRFETILRQARIVLLLKSRAVFSGLEYPLFTIDNLHSGVLSLHRLLAQDTLEFGLRADQALEHEDRCREVYLHRNKATVLAQPALDLDSSITASKTSSSGGNSETLLAWGKVADKRWRDLLALALTEDSNNATTNSPDVITITSASSNTAGSNNNSKLKRKRKPMLLFFPLHNHATTLGCYRALLMSDRWAKQYHTIETLVVVCEHLFEVMNPWRGLVAMEIYSKHIFPLLQLFLHLEEEVENSADYSVDPVRSQQLMMIMKEIPMVKSLVTLTVEILNYIKEIIPSSAATSNSFLLDESSSNEAQAASGEDGSDSKPWPPLQDTFLQTLRRTFYQQVSLQAVQQETILYHMTLAYVMQLRFQCSLRGVKPSAVLGGATLLQEITEGDFYSNLAYKTAACRRGRLNTQLLVASDAQSIRRRAEFLDLSFQRVIQEERPQAIYALASMWGFEADIVRLLHIQALLECGDVDNEIEEMIPQFENMSLVTDALLSHARLQLGRVILGIEKVPTYGPLLAAMDAEALLWAKQVASSERSHSRQQKLATVPVHQDATAAASADPVKSVQSLQMKRGSGNSSPIPRPALKKVTASSGKPSSNVLDITSTRRIIIYLESLLLAVPVKDRSLVDDTSKALSEEWNRYGPIPILQMTRYSGWIERKSRCDALLSLCNVIVQAVTKSGNAISRREVAS